MLLSEIKVKNKGMIKQFIFQNRGGGGKKINKSYFYFYGPNYTVPKITDSNIIVPLHTTNCLFGVSFDYPLDCNDWGQYFKITVSLSFDYSGSDTPLLQPINYTVSVGTIEDTGIGSDHKNFAIPVTLSFPVASILRMRFNSATIEICNPNPKYDYIAPTNFSTSGEYIAVNTNLYMDISQFGRYRGMFKADLYNSSTGILVVNKPMTLEFNANSNPYIRKLQTNWAKRVDLVSSMTRPQLDLKCVDKDGMASNMYMGVSYAVLSYYLIGVKAEIYTILSAVEQIRIPIIAGETAVNEASNYIEESLVRDYLIYNINTRLQ